MSPEVWRDLLHRALSPAVPAQEAARFFDGLFAGAVQNLLYDTILLNAIEAWLINLDEEDFTEFLPLFRRIFADLDAMERKRLLDTLLHGRAQTQQLKVINQAALTLWPLHLKKIGKLMNRDKTWSQ
jgi:hypothetical protein